MIRRDVEKSLRNMFERGYKQGYEEALKKNALKENKGEWISIDDVMSVFDDFMCGEVDEEGTATFLEMLKDKAESEE